MTARELNTKYKGQGGLWAALPFVRMPLGKPGVIAL